MRTLLAICCLSALPISPARADELGRLFFTPAQRAQMDRGYAQLARPGHNVNTLTLNGIVQMHGGKRTVWINGVPQPAGPSDDRSPASLPVPLPGRHKSVELKVGQRLLLDTSANPDTAKPDTAKPFSTDTPTPGTGKP